MDGPEDRPSEDGPVALLRAAAAATLRHKVKLALWMAICLAAAFVYARTTPPTYTAAASLLLEPRRQILTAARETVAPPTLDLNRTDSELQVIRSERLLTTVFEALGLADHPEFGPQPESAIRGLARRAIAVAQAGWRDIRLALERAGVHAGDSDTLFDATAATPGAIPDQRRVAFANFARRFSARRVGQSYVLEIAYSSSDPDLPARVANAAASAYVLQSVAFKADAARSGAEFLQGRLDALSAQVGAASDAVRTGTLPSVPTPDADAKIIGAAQPPLGASAPGTGLILGFGAVFGLLSGIFASAIASALDRRVRRPQDIGAATGLPCLATIPKASAWHGLRRFSGREMAMLVSHPRAPAFAVAVRDLRTSIEIARRGGLPDGNLVVAIGGWNAGVGATLLGMNLALLIERGGRSVSVFSSDLVEARRAEESENPVYASLVDAVVGKAALDQVSFCDVSGVRVLPIQSSVRELNRFVDFRDPLVAKVFAHERQFGDVLIDLPPLSESSDALALATHADLVVLVASADSTTVEHLSHAYAKLRRAGVNVLGVVLNRAPRQC